jgi:hypothetical protein
MRARDTKTYFRAEQQGEPASKTLFPVARGIDSELGQEQASAGRQAHHQVPGQVIAIDESAGSYALPRILFHEKTVLQATRHHEGPVGSLECAAEHQHLQHGLYSLFAVYQGGGQEKARRIGEALQQVKARVGGVQRQGQPAIADMPGISLRGKGCHKFTRQGECLYEHPDLHQYQQRKGETRQAPGVCGNGNAIAQVEEQPNNQQGTYQESQ